ncbi:DNA-3-methyladenine glycosylase II [Salvia divinorum]|uniref:DNA-3-methyladenine glycosylase II n=1 Tax=Salvia divinorum TaxID=28513 RepID=A0ABD1G069_SALDI
MDDRSLFTMLSMVKGIGSWSVHMFMIFSLCRPDVFPVSDLGVRKGVKYLYGLEELPQSSQMQQLCEKWKPYRSPVQQIDPHQDGHQLQFVESVKGIGNVGACIRNQ